MRAKSPSNIDAVAQALTERYSDFDHHNLSDPLDELLFIICSQKTTQSGYRETYSALRTAFPTNELLSAASRPAIASVITRGGLSQRKSKAIRALLDEIIDQFGAPSLDRLQEMDDNEAEQFLISLPGVGRKIARCVMLYSLKRQVFPVDTHCWRVSRRLGWVRRTRFDGRCSPRDMDRLQNKIPDELRFSLHVNMVSLGREFCRPRNPRCPVCPIADFCKRIGVRSRI